MTHICIREIYYRLKVAASVSQKKQNTYNCMEALYIRAGNFQTSLRVQTPRAVSRDRLTRWPIVL